jgi:ribosomal protein L37AE/L43A
LTDIMASVRTPWFCPKCKKAMKKKLDDKFWRLMGHCFDCQVEFENKLRINDYSEYEKYAELKVLENQKSYLKDLRESIKEFEKSGGKQTWLNQVGVAAPDVEEETWEMGKEKFETMVENAHEHLKNLQNKLDEKEKQLTGA